MLISLSGEARRQRFWPRMASPRAAAVLVILVIFTYLTFTHQLSPYMVVVQMAALAAFRLVRPRWIPLVLAAIAVVYLVPRYSFVATHYGVTKSIGHLLSNIKPPSASAPDVSAAQHLIQRCAEALSILIWALAGFGAWRHRGGDRSVRTLALLAYSPVAVLAMGAYGNEGILRVYLFSLPWSAALAAMILAPSRAVPSSARSPRIAAMARYVRRVAWSAADALRVPAALMRPGIMRIPVTLGIVLALFFPTFFGDDGFNYMTKAEVDVTRAFWLHSQPGHVFMGIDAAPVADTWRYDQFPLSSIFGGTLYQTPSAVTYRIAGELAHKADHQSHGHKPAYILITDNMIAYNNAYGITGPHSFDVLLYSLRHSSLWTPIVNRDGVMIYELPPQQTSGAIP